MTQGTRRSFLGAAGVAMTAGYLSAYARPPGDRLFAYVGRHTDGAVWGYGKGGGVDVFRVDSSTGQLRQVSKTGTEVDDMNSDGICVSADRRFLYSINSTPQLGRKPGAGGGVVSFAINPENGSLRYLNRQASMGTNPASVAMDRTGARVIVANHGAGNRAVLVNKRDGVPVIESPIDDGTVALFPVNPDGSLEPASDVAVLARKPDPRNTTPGQTTSATGVPLLQIGAACHTAVFDRTQRWIIATDNGFDHIYVFPFSPSSRRIEGTMFPTPRGRAPRHVAIHPRAPYFFITNEREATVSSFSFDSGNGEVRPVQTIATVAPDYSGPHVAPSGIRIHPEAKYLYSLNRGDNSICIFGVEETTGRLTRIDVVKTGGVGPRELNIDPSGRFLFVPDVQSNDVVTFAIDSSTGRITQTSRISVVRGAVIDFATL